VDIIRDELEVLHAPPAPKRWKDIWRHELKIAKEEKQNLSTPDYSEIKRSRRRKTIIVKPKRKIKRKTSNKKKR
jgi:hypothetical protein